MSVYDHFLEIQEQVIQQELYYNQLIDECCTCTAERFEMILQQLPSTYHNTALNASIRCMNRKVLKKYLPNHPEVIPFVLLYCCQLDYSALIKFLVTWIKKYDQDHLLSRSNKNCCIWWCFRNRNIELSGYLMMEWTITYEKEEFDNHFIEVVPPYCIPF